MPKNDPSELTGPSQSEINALVDRFSNGQYAEAEAGARRIIEAWPDQAFGWKAMGAALTSQGRLSEALPALQKTLELLPSDAETQNNLGVALKSLGRLSEAQACFRRALEVRPDFHEAHNNLGNTLQALGQLSEAEASYRRALNFKPDYDEAHANLGNVLQNLGRMAEAEASCRRALELKPDNAGAHSSLGSILQSVSRLNEAEAHCRRALELAPDFAEAHCNLGNALQSQGRLSEAEASYQRALAVKPHMHQAHANLGGALHSLGRLSEAEASHRRALELKPDFQPAYSNLGLTLQAAGRISEAAACYRRVLQFAPDFHVAHSHLIFALDLLEGCSTAEQQAERTRWYTQHAQRYGASITPHENLADPERRLRIGYVSAHFHKHAASYAFGPIIRLHERSAFEVICYCGGTFEDETTARLRQAAEEWHSTAGVSDEDLAGQIRHDRIDILVDLSAHMAGSRLLAFARKPAPVQLTAWGYPGGTGLKTIDYLLADRVVIPAEERGLYAEEVLDLPCFLCYEAPASLPEVSPLPALGGRPFTFGCISRIEKISDGAIALWSRILAAMPEAQLLVKGQALDDPGHHMRFAGKLRHAGIGAERVRLIGSSSHADLLKTFHQVDLGLDPFPHGGAIGTAEALWMGVPVVTLQGATFMSRIAASILTALQMQEWIAHSDEEYVRIAVQAAADLGRLARTREQLRSRLAASIFCDVERYTRAVETVYRQVWRRWCASQNGTASSLRQNSINAASRR